jgi:dipeptidyl aminopeptidase/acylaminoacyl peptidase
MRINRLMPALLALLVQAGAHARALQGQTGWTPELAFTVKRVGGVAISPDGRWAAVAVSEPVMERKPSAWRTSVHMYPLGGTAARAAARVETPASAPVWSADGRWLAFASDRSGKRNVWRVATDGGPAERLTDVAGDLGEFRWSPDGRRLAYVLTDPPADAEPHVVGEGLRFARLYVLDVEGAAAGRAARLLTPQDVQVGGHAGAGLSGAAFDWSPDGSAIAFSHAPSPLGDDWVRADVSVVDVATGRVRPLAATPAAEGGVAWSPDGRWVAVTVSDAPATYALTFRVVLVSPADGTTRPLAHSFDRRPAVVGWTGDARYVVITEPRGTLQRLSLLSADGLRAVDISPDTLMVSGAALNATGTHVGFVSEAPDRAPEPYASRLATFAPVRVAGVQSLPAIPFGKTEAIRWRSFDGREIEGLLTYPVDYRPGSRVPLLVILHGGPPSSFMRTFTGGATAYPIASFAAAGFAVLRPNVRGSSGYGREFRYANVRDWGGGDFRDAMAGIDALVERGVGDADRLGVMGWSYGGYLTAFTITQTTRFRAASVGAGITNLVSYAGVADIPGFIGSYFGSEFWDAPELWHARSAVLQVKAVTTPTLIQHGENDRRVPISQGYELYTALKRRNVPVAMVVYPRQGHGVGEPALQLDIMHRNLEWFKRWVLAGRK